MATNLKIASSETYRDLDSDALEDIEELIRLGMGDTQRLNHMKSMLQKGRVLYNSDRAYVEKLKKFLEDDNDSIDDQPPKAGLQAPDTPSPPETDTVPPSTIETAANSAKDNDKIVLTVNQSPGSSAAWYLLPLFFSIIGGAISYMCIKREDPTRARRTLILGVCLFAVQACMIIGIFLIAYEDTGVPTTDMSDNQIRKDAVTIPYDSLMDESHLYEGKAVYYKGRVLQAFDNFFGSYTMRMDISNNDTLFESDSIMLNFEPSTDEEKQWVENIRRNPDIFGLDSHDAQIWGIYRGFIEVETLLGGINTIPEVDVHMLEINMPDPKTEEIAKDRMPDETQSTPDEDTGVPTTDMSDNQIRKDAVTIPYDSLMDDDDIGMVYINVDKSEYTVDDTIHITGKINRFDIPVKRNLSGEKVGASEQVHVALYRDGDHPIYWPYQATLNCVIGGGGPSSLYCEANRKEHPVTEFNDDDGTFSIDIDLTGDFIADEYVVKGSYRVSEHSVLTETSSQSFTMVPGPEKTWPEPVDYDGVISILEGASTPVCEEGTECIMPSTGDYKGWKKLVDACEEAGRCFMPYSVSVSAGEEIIWSNDDSTAHTVTSDILDSFGEHFNSDIIEPGNTFSLTLDEPGEYPYRCQMHPYMTGIVYVN